MLDTERLKDSWLVTALVAAKSEIAQCIKEELLDSPLSVIKHQYNLARQGLKFADPALDSEDGFALGAEAALYVPVTSDNEKSEIMLRLNERAEQLDKNMVPYG